MMSIYRFGHVRAILTSLVLSIGLAMAWSTESKALEMYMYTNNQTGAYVVTQTNNKGYNVLYWNFKLPATFTGTGAANTITSLKFDLWQNSPQSGAGVIPENIAIYNGFFGPTRYNSTTGSDSTYLPTGNTYSTPISANGDPADGYVTVKAPDTANGQLNICTLTPGVNEPYGVHNVNPTMTNAFNGTNFNANGEYSIVIWTTSTQNYQIKNAGQLMISIPGVSGIMSSSSPGYLDAASNGSPIVQPGSLSVVPVPEPSTYVLGILGTLAMAFAARRRKALAAA